jgi:hypothetical protein
MMTDKIQHVRQRIQAEIDEATNPRGMSTHSGRTRILAADVRYLLAAHDDAARTERKAIAGRLRELAEQWEHAEFRSKGATGAALDVRALADELAPPPTTPEGGTDGR